MKEQFDTIRLSKDNQDKLQIINDIIEEYHQQGYRMTLRQLYYQLVSRDVIPNTTKEYAKISDILVKGRMAGIVDWYAIEDRIRVPRLPYFAENIADAINDLCGQYRLDRQEGQNCYIEVWCEKDALSGIISNITSKYHIRLMINRGYSSATAMYDASKRMIKEIRDGKTCYILYLGDHDPSGIDMVRDVYERLLAFGVGAIVEPIALTTAQVKKYNPPPNPAKVTDPRAKKYISQFGRVSWEIDALKPEVLVKLVEGKILSLIDVDMYKEKLEQEEWDKKRLYEIAGEA